MLEGRVLLAVLEHLVEVVVVIHDLVVYNLAVLLNWNDFRIDEAAIWLEAKRRVTIEDLLMKDRIDIDRIFLDKSFTGLEVTLGLDSLHFC